MDTVDEKNLLYISTKNYTWELNKKSCKHQSEGDDTAFEKGSYRMSR